MVKKTPASATPVQAEPVITQPKNIPYTLVEDDTRNQILFPAFDALQSGVFVELGTFLGGNLARCVDYIGDKPISCIGVDNWLCDNISQQAKDAAGVQGAYEDEFIKAMDGRTFKHYCCDSLEAVSNFDDGSIDVLFIDDGHCYDHVKANITAWLPKVKTGGLIAFHDFPDNEVNFAIKEKFPNIQDNHHSGYTRI